MNRKLYHLLRSVETPMFCSVDRETGEYVAQNRMWPALFAMTWPNGYPCVIAEMYLMERSFSLTVRPNDGGSLKVVASDISQLIRYCASIQTGFENLGDEEMYRFVEELKQEKQIAYPARRKRNNNTVRRIIDNCIHFLIWLQSNILVDQTLVGTKGEDPNIACKEKSYIDYHGQRRARLEYPFKPTVDTPDPKGPISRDKRFSLWDAVQALSDRSPLQQENHRLVKELDYLRARRELLLLLLESTGARPGELARIRVSAIVDCLKNNKIVLSTLKRGRKSGGGKDPERKIPVDPSVAIKLGVFIKKHRRELIDRLNKRGIRAEPDDALFLCSKKGTPLSEHSLGKEFQRIRVKAGIEERACMSMFRHRFITNMVVLHLKGFLEMHPGKTRMMVTESDYRTILKRVAAFTGHKSLDSLLHYIDLAWEEIGLFDYVEPAKELANSVELAVFKLQSLSSDIKFEERISSQQVIDIVLSELDAIRDCTIKALQKNAQHSKN